MSSLNVILISEKKISTEQEVGDNWFRLDKVDEMKWKKMHLDWLHEKVTLNNV